MLEDENPTETESTEIPPYTPHELMRFFKFEHLSQPAMRETSEWFCELAERIDHCLWDGNEKTACLRKLLEANDCAVRTIVQALEDKR